MKHSYEVEHVLMTADAVGGVWTYAVDLARELARGDIRTTLAVMGPEPTLSQRRDAESIAGLTLHAKPYKLEWMEDPWSDVDKAGEWLLDLAERERPNVVHLNGYCHASLPWRQPTMAVCHSCVLSWWEAVYGEASLPAKYSEYERRVGEGLRRADVVVAPTAAMLKTSKRLYGPFKDSRVIYNGRSTGELFTGKKRPMVLAVGRTWDEAKNFSVLDAAAPDALWPIYLAGASNDPETGRPRHQNVNALGQLCASALAAWYSRSSILAHPAKYEPFGLSVLEAAVSGCALVLSDIPTLRELWDDAAVFVDPNDSEEWARALNWLAEDDEVRAEFQAAAKERAKEYSVRAMACGTLFAYQDLVQAAILPEPSFHVGARLQ